MLCPKRLGRAVIANLRRLRIFPRLLLVFCALLIISTLLISLMNQRNYGHEIETTTMNYLSLLVQNASYKLEQETRRFEESMQLFTQNERLLNAAAENRGREEDASFEDNRRLIEQQMLALMEQTGGIKTLVFVADDVQYCTAASQNNERGAFFRDLDAFYSSEIYRTAVEAKGYPVWLDSTKTTSSLLYENDTAYVGILGCVTLTYQVYTPTTREPLGVLVCCIYPSHLTEVLSEYSSQNGGNTFIVGNGGMVEGIAADFSGPPFLSRRDALLHYIFTAQDGSTIVEDEGKKLLVSHSGRSGFPIQLVNLTYRDHVLRRVRQMEVRNMLVLVLVMIIGGVCFYFAAVSIAHPVRKLISAMQRVGHGDFTAVYPPEGSDEIGVLCNEFNQMVDNTQQLIDQVYVAQIRENELRLSEKNAQLDMLQMQISPHFLYNTLDMIRWECMYEGGADSHAADMTEKFCLLLRMTIKGDRSKESVAESLRHAATYLEVVNFRHTHPIRLESSFTFDTACYQLPRLTLQPMLENAVRHGFAGEESNNHIITVSGELVQAGQMLRLRVLDNGRGMTPEQLAALRENLSREEIGQDSIGLKNVSQRCRLCYGETAHLFVDSVLGNGTCVTLLIPAEEYGEEEAHV